MGEGTYGKVYSALDTKTRKKVAVKLEPRTMTSKTGRSKVIETNDLSINIEYTLYKRLKGIGNGQRILYIQSYLYAFNVLSFTIYINSLSNYFLMSIEMAFQTFGGMENLLMTIKRL